MSGMRSWTLAHRWRAAALLAATLLLRLLVPVGFMPDFAGGRMQVAICTGAGPMKMAMAMPASTSGRSDGDHRSERRMSCPFAGLSAPTLAGGDPPSVVLAIARWSTVVLGELSCVRVTVWQRLRPPLRGPPDLA